MTHLTNAKRAVYAAEGLLRYVQSKEGRPYGELETVLTDYLSDLMHHAEIEGTDFEACLKRATSHFQDELMEEQIENVHTAALEMFEALKAARSELEFQQQHFPRADDTALREALHAVCAALAIAEGRGS